MFFFSKRNNLKSLVLLKLNTNGQLFSFVIEKGCLGKYKMVRFLGGPHTVIRDILPPLHNQTHEQHFEAGARWSARPNTQVIQ